MLLSFLFSCIILALSPGPDNMYLISLTLKYGKKVGFLFIFGLVLGCFVHTLLLAFGFSILIVQSELMFNIIKYFGFAYLVYLSLQVYFYDSVTTESKKIKIEKSNSIFLKKGFLMNLLNPKIFIFFVAFFPNFIFSDSISVQLQIIFLGLIFIGTTILIFGMFSFFSDYLHVCLNKSKRSKIIIKWVNILVLLTISFLILFAENNLTLD